VVAAESAAAAAAEAVVAAEAAAAAAAEAVVAAANASHDARVAVMTAIQTTAAAMSEPRRWWCLPRWCSVTHVH